MFQRKHQNIDYYLDLKNADTGRSNSASEEGFESQVQHLTDPKLITTGKNAIKNAEFSKKYGII